MNFSKALVLLMLIPFTALSQVTFIATSIPASTPPGANLYIAGNFNSWDPGNPDFMMHKNAMGKWEITLDSMAAGTTIKFKFTMGSWESVEKGASGEEIPDRSFTYGNGDTVNVAILNWAGGGAGQSTAAANVSIIDENFLMPQLNRNRRVWIYYPPDYETTTKNYPVLYMHDGQNLFDEVTSFMGEWEVDETLNKLHDEGYSVPIVVGIENGGYLRIAEYTPFINPQYGGGDGELYMQFIVETLKPYIDSHFRTLTDKENTGIMGSSLGGLISHYGILQYPDVFGKAGLLSPSYWYSDSIWDYTSSKQAGYGQRIYQMCGSAEGSNTDVNMLRMSDSLLAIGLPESNIRNVIIPGGQHNEALWRNNFREAYLWLFLGVTNSIDENETGGWLLYPNPAGDQIRLEHPDGLFPDSVIIYNQFGQVAARFKQNTTGIYDVSRLSKGNYLVAFTLGNKTRHLKFIRH